MYPLTYLLRYYGEQWHRIAWEASTPESANALDRHGMRLSQENGGRYRLVQPSTRAGYEYDVIRDYSCVSNFYVEKSTRRKKVAAALYRHSRIIEAERNHIPDPDTYAGWFPWENLGSKQDEWLRAADVAIENMAATC